MTVENTHSLPERQLIVALTDKYSPQYEATWKRFHQESYPKVKSMCLRRGLTIAEAEDVFQEGMNSLFSNLTRGDFRHDSLVFTYFYGICNKLVAKKFRRDNRRQEVELEFRDAVELCSDYDPEYDIMLGQVTTILMEQLEESCRNVLIEAFHKGKCNKELQEFLNVSTEQAAKNKKWRCLRYFRKLCQEAGIDPILRRK